MLSYTYSNLLLRQYIDRENNYFVYILPSRFSKNNRKWPRIGFLEVKNSEAHPYYALFSLSLYNKTLEEKIFFDFDFHTGLLTKVEKM